MIRALLGLSAILLIAETVFLGFQGHSPRAGYAPEQPIPFSHKLHAGEMGLDCQYCHTQPEKGRQATVPSLNICMNCHSQVKKRVGAEEDSPHLAKLRDHFERGEPVAWTRVYDLPDYVYFSHQPHVGHAGISCQTCHGNVQDMDTVEIKVPFNMGWCLDCHRSRPGFINAPVFGPDGDIERFTERRNPNENDTGKACTMDVDCKHGEACRGAGEDGGHICVTTDYALSAHLNTAAPQSCTTCHR
jgi:hypothetical protein